MIQSRCFKSTENIDNTSISPDNKKVNHKTKVQSLLMNSIEFREAFTCKQGDVMFKSKVCKVY